MFTGITCHYSTWGEYVILPCHHQDELLAVDEPLMITGINPSQHRCNIDQQKETQSTFVRKIIQNDEKKCSKYIMESVKDEAKRKGVECPSNTVPLMINQTHMSHRKRESFKMKTTQAINTRSPKNFSYQPKTRTKLAYQHKDTFKPCDTCKQIIAFREKLFVEFKSTLQKSNNVEAESISQVTVDKSCHGREDVSVAHLPVITHDTTSPVDKKLSKSFLEKSDLVKSKERIEELLHKRRKQLFSFLDCIDSSVSPVPQDFSLNDDINSSLESLTVGSMVCSDSGATVQHPTNPQHLNVLNIKNRRGALTNNDPLVPIPNQGNFMRILQKSSPDNKGFVSWQNLACIKLRGYQVEIIRTFIHHLGISYWRLRYLVPKAAGALSHTSWVQINSLYFNVMITPYNKTINLSIFNLVTSAEVANKEMVTSKDPDVLLEQLTPIPNAFSPMPPE